MDWTGDKLVHGVWCSICWFFLAGCAKGGVGPVLTRADGGFTICQYHELRQT